MVVLCDAYLDNMRYIPWLVCMAKQQRITANYQTLEHTLCPRALSADLL